MATERKLNDVFIEGFTGELWYIKEMPCTNTSGYYRMADCYGIHPDRMLSVSGMEDMIANKMLKFGWSAKDAKRWRK
jgi:hypothetical protein